MNLDALKKLADEHGLHYYVSPERQMLAMGFTGLNGNYHIVVLLDNDGRFLQFRTDFNSYLTCPVESPNLNAVLRLLATLDYQLRVAKFGWDARDGEIMVYADVWLEDATMTQTQFSELVRCFVTAIDMNYKRIATTIATGTDPGDLKPEDILGMPGLPPELRTELERMLGKKEDDRPEGPQEV
jgi:hypothetical protein